jgi:hypothetical protein
MRTPQNLIKVAVLVQITLWAILLAIFLVVLPGQGFRVFDDFNDPAKVSAVPMAMSFISWSDALFGLTMLPVVFGLVRFSLARMPTLVRRLLAAILFAAVAWFIAHDVGIHLIGLAAIERDPASTNYAADRALWAVRNGVFLAVGILTFALIRRGPPCREVSLPGSGAP